MTLILISLLGLAATGAAVWWFVGTKANSADLISSTYQPVTTSAEKIGGLYVTPPGKYESPSYRADRSITARAWSDDGSVLAIARNDFSIDLIDTRTRIVKSIYNKKQENGVKTYCLKFDGPNRLLMAGVRIKGKKLSKEDRIGQACLVTFDLKEENPIKKVVPLPVTADQTGSYSISPDLSKIMINQRNRSKIYDIKNAATIVDDQAFDVQDTPTLWASDSSGCAYVSNEVLTFRSIEKSASFNEPMPDGRFARWPLWVDKSELAVVCKFLSKMQVVQFQTSSSGISVVDRHRFPGDPNVEVLAAQSGAGFGKVKAILRLNSIFFEAREKENTAEVIPTEIKSEQCEAKFSADGEFFTLASKNTVYLFDAASHQVLSTLAPERFNKILNQPQSVSVEWAPGANLIIVLGDGNSGTIEIVDVLNAARH